MSNLGAYQWITSASKKVGGPVNLLLLTGATGAVIGKLCEIGLKKGVAAINARILSKYKSDDPMEKIYSVTATGENKEGVIFVVGDQYKVLERDNDSVLIEKIDDVNNPYFVSVDFLRTVSNYQE